MQIVRKYFSFLSRNHLEFWQKRDSRGVMGARVYKIKYSRPALLTSEFHQWYINTPKPCNGVDFSEATPEARFIFRHTAGRLSPLRGLFFAPKTGV